MVPITEAELDLLRSELVPRLAEILDEAGELEHVESIERMACELLVPFGCTDGPPELSRALVEAVEHSHAPASLDLLAALSKLGSGEVARTAADAYGRRAGRDRSRFEGSIGGLEAIAAASVRDGAAEILQVRFKRRDSGEHQLGALFLEHGETGGAALGGMITAPQPEPAPFLASGGGARPRALQLDGMRDRAQAALGRTAELELAVEHELGVCLPLIAIGLTGSPDGLPVVDVELPDSFDGEPAEGDRGPLYVDPLDDDAYRLIEGALMDELDGYLEGEAGGSDHTHFFAGSLLHWKWGYAGGQLGRWTCADLAEFMLDYAPRKLPSDDETIAQAPAAIATFLSFLDARGSLAGDPLGALLAEAECLGETYAAAARDPGNWGMAKPLFAQMEADGVDPTREGALDAWMEDFNSRPREARDRALGSPLARTAPLRDTGGPDPGSAQPTQRSKAPRRGKRKQARAARRHNRR